MNVKSEEETLHYKRILGAGLVLVGLFLAGCAALQTSTTQSLPTFAGEKPTPDKALITVEGGPSFSGMIKLYAIKVRDDNTLVGKVGPRGKMVWQRDPGRMVLTLGDDAYGSDWCQGRIHTVEAGKAYTFNIENIGGAYSIAGPGMSIEDEQTLNILTGWKQLRAGMSMGEVANLIGGGVLDRVTPLLVSTRALSWYRVVYWLKFEEGKLSGWAIFCQNPKCIMYGKLNQNLVPKETRDGKDSISISCPYCGHPFFPARQAAN